MPASQQQAYRHCFMTLRVRQFAKHFRYRLHMHWLPNRAAFAVRWYVKLSEAVPCQVRR